ncbi:MAG: ATP-dependent helicase, partial [Bacteroidetes bacterium]
MAVIKNKKQVLFLIHRIDLAKQTIKAYESMGIECGLIASGYAHDYSKPVQVALIQTLKNRIAKKQVDFTPGVVFGDEVHLSASKTYLSLLDYYKAKGSLLIGLTATPARLDGKPLDHFSSMVLGPRVKWLIENKKLSKYKIFAPSTVDVSSLRLHAGDFRKEDMAKLVDKPNITGCAINEFKKINVRQGIVFCITIEHSNNVVDAFNAVGITAKHIDGKTKKDERDQIIEDFRQGKIRILSSVGILSEGIDIPVLDAVILLRPTASLALYIQ